MLEYVAAANAAYSVIRKAIENGKELHDCAKAVADITHAEDALRNKSNEQKNSFWTKISGKSDGDLESFMALEKVKEQQKQLKEAMIYYGRPGLHADYVRFCVEARKSREYAIKEKAKAWRDLKETILLVILWALGIMVLCGILVGVVIGLQNRGHL
tara:strand:- start:382 stop:852 length:471 start_codon:yes stop_codon:yes gene_type:complete